MSLKPNPNNPGGKSNQHILGYLSKPNTVTIDDITPLPAEFYQSSEFIRAQEALRATQLNPDYPLFKPEASAIQGGGQSAQLLREQMFTATDVILEWARLFMAGPK